MKRTTVRNRTFGSATAAIALLAVSACGGTDDGDGVASAGGETDPAATEDTESLDEDAQALLFAECMRDNGVDMPDPAPGQEGMGEAFRHGGSETDDRASFDQALTACEDLLPRRARGDEVGPDDDMMLALADCLRDQGLDVPDNLFEDGGIHDLDEDELRSAQEECRDVMPGGMAGDHD